MPGIRKLLWLLAVPAAAHAGWAGAQAYPSKPMKLLVGFTPGGGVDINARLLASKLSELLRPAGGRREPPRRRHQHRQRIRRKGGARRLHAAVQQPGRRHQHVAVQESSLRHAARFRRRVGVLRQHQHPGGARFACPQNQCRNSSRSRARGPERSTIPPPAPGSTQHLAARTVQAAHRDRHRARSLQGQRAVDRRADRCRSPALLRQSGRHRPAREVGAPARDSASPARSAPSSCPRCRR